MPKVKFYVMNGDNVLGTMWETSTGREVFVLMSDWDINFGLEIFNPDNNELIDDVDSLELLMNILPR